MQTSTVFLDCFRKGTSGEQVPTNGHLGQPAFAEAVKLFNSCQQGSGNGCDAELLKSANHYMDVQNNGEGPECRDVRKSAQECTKFVQNKKTIDGSAGTASRDCVNNRYDTSMRTRSVVRKARRANKLQAAGGGLPWAAAGRTLKLGLGSFYQMRF
ncbi:hypothetical protein MHUMG1_01847 [Metarhizium humberi]|uniref:Uncharacterized protein n=1 Tax=Metarhizium humberi TaxID=2596975 RepID=A0A9P8MI56_9HYPO|nr:hypothetical protein MHUMG1_01847 [Metarhizium humberi]